MTDAVPINGVAGIISSHLVERLFNLEYPLKGLDNSGRFHPSDYEAYRNRYPGIGRGVCIIG
jgi:hypothetical protein